MGKTRTTIRLSRMGGGASDAPVAVDVPTKIGPVELVRQVGAGGMGVVWLGRHEVLARDVAVKFLFVPPGASDEHALDLFVQGARAAAAVRHAGLTGVHDAGVVGGVPFVIMEYVDGPTLADVLRRGPLTLPVARAVLAQVCAAVGALHESDLIHRDIKPSNIMVDQSGLVFVTDFGLACPRSVRAREGGLEGTETPRVAGTPGFMAPEMYTGEVSAKSDVYAIGATAFELLTGESLCEGTLAEVRAAAERGGVRRGALEKRGVPEGVIVAIERCMNKDAIYRPRGAGRLVELFESAFASAKPSITSATREEVRRAAFPNAGAGVSAGSQPAPPSPTPPTPPPTGETMFGLVSRFAEVKRRQSTPQPVEVEPEPVTPPVVAEVREGGHEVVVESASAQPQASQSTQVPASRSPVRAIPVQWWTLSFCAIIGATVATVTLTFLYSLHNGHLPILAAYKLADFLHVSDTRSGPGVVDGVEVQGFPPTFLTYCVFFVFAALPSALAGLLAFGAYHRVGFLRPMGRPNLMCGWCGYDLAGISTTRCPECGRGFDDRGKRGDRPPARRWMVRARVVSVSLAALVLVGWVATVITKAATYALETRANVAFPKSMIAQGILGGITIALPTFFLGLLAYHFVARRTAMLDGVVRCGNCGARGETLRKGKCLWCERVAGAGASPSRPWEAFDRLKWSRLPWRALLACSGVGAVVIYGTMYVVSRHTHSSLYYACRVSEWLGNLAENGKGSVGVDGIGFKGLPPLWVEIMVLLVVRVLPIVLLALATVAVYHRLALARVPWRKGPVCGWCGYDLAGIEAVRCPECGRGFEDRGKRGDRPPARRLRSWVPVVAQVLLVLFGMLLLYSKFEQWVVIRIGLNGQPEWVDFLPDLLLLAFPTCVAGLGAYDLGVRKFLALDGKVRCGKCGAGLKAVGAGACEKCAAGSTVRAPGASRT